MPAPEAPLQPAESYPFSAQISTRYSDLDPQNHVNNVAVAAIYEEGRSRFIAWLVANIEQDLEPPQRMIAEVRIRYLKQIHYPTTLSVTAKILHIGERSYRIGQALFQAGVCLGMCETVIVHSDGLRSVAISEAWRSTLLRACKD